MNNMNLLVPQWMIEPNNIWKKGFGCNTIKDNKVEYLGEWISPCYDENKDYINYISDKYKQQELVDNNDSQSEKLDFIRKKAIKVLYKIGNWKEYVYPHMYQINYEYEQYYEDEYNYIDMEDEMYDNLNIDNMETDDNDYDEYNKNRSNHKKPSENVR